jgi:UDP-N-acetylmuramoyl-tripeptide--D-alanyl-D-alanine ligase
MEGRSLQFFAGSCGGEMRNVAPEKLASRVCIDSREAQPGDLFVAIKGEKFDGHDFVGEVLGKSVAAVVIEREKLGKVPGEGPFIVVENTREALGKIAAAYRRQYQVRAIAICGSNGKTSTKELVAAVLSEKIKTIKSEASFNNDIGVPLTLLKLAQETGAAVLEAGTNHPGELLPLLRLIQPGLGVITSIGREHLEHFRDLEGVLAEEGSLARVLPAEGTLFLNGDAPESRQLSEWTAARVIRVGRGDGNEWRITKTRMNASGTTFALETRVPKYSGEYATNLFGEHQVLNAAYAVAVGAELGLEREEIARGLSKCKPAKMRLEAKKIDDFMVLDDAYNANADSMAAALRTLQEFPCAGRRIAVLGDMAELGHAAAAAHAEIGRRAAEAGVNFLITVGNLSNTVATAAKLAGLQEVFAMRDVPEAAGMLKELVRSGDVVLVKASRSSKLERVVQSLEERFKK